SRREDENTGLNNMSSSFGKPREVMPAWRIEKRLPVTRNIRVSRAPVIDQMVQKGLPLMSCRKGAFIHRPDFFDRHPFRYRRSQRVNYYVCINPNNPFVLARGIGSEHEAFLPRG